MGKYAALLRRAVKSVDYWAQIAMREFVHDLANRMENRDMTRAALAKEIGASPAYISRVMRGDVNFTLETMTKLALATGGKLHVSIAEVSARSEFVPLAQTLWDVGSVVKQYQVLASRELRLENLGDAANDGWIAERGVVGTRTGGAFSMPANALLAVGG